MQGPYTLAICQTEKGRFKVYVCGHADGHLMEWAGSNYRFTPIGDQPRLGFDTFEEAEEMQRLVESSKSRMEREEYWAHGTSGSYIPTERYVHRCDCKGCRRVTNGEFAFCQDNCAPPYRMSGWCANHEAQRLEATLEIPHRG